MDRPKRGRAVPGLPDDIVVDILSCVPAKSLRDLKLVSPAWRDLISDPVHRKRLPQTLEGFFHGRSGRANDTYGRFTKLSGGPGPEVDPSFSFLTKLPWIKRIVLTGSCNGLLLFECATTSQDSFGYIVCNPATEELVFVPSPSGYPPPVYLEGRRVQLNAGEQSLAFTLLMFDPAVSSHFRLVQLWQHYKGIGVVDVDALHFYSSETGEWSDRLSDKWKQALILRYHGTAFVDGMLHFVMWQEEIEFLIIAVDGVGNTCRTIRWPEKHRLFDCGLFIGQSQGRLHCISLAVDKKYRALNPNYYKLSVWVLEDYDTQKWILKHNVPCSKAFGRFYTSHFNLKIVAIHPDRNVLFFVHDWKDRSLVSYDMDSGKLRLIQILGDGYRFLFLFTPYVPYFMESAEVANKY